MFAARGIALTTVAALGVGLPAVGIAITDEPTHTFTVTEADRPAGTPPDITAGGVTTWFTGMYSLQGNPRGHTMGFGPAGTGPWTTALVFGSGARIVARGPDANRTILGGTGRYLGARGTLRSTLVRGVLQHRVTYSLPPRGTRRTGMSVRVRFGTPVITERGGPSGVGNGRAIEGVVVDGSGASIGTYRVDSTLVHVFAGGTREWFLGDFTYALPGGTLRSVGPYPRASVAAPGTAAPSGRVVTGGTGAYAGMRGQVVVLPPNADGSSTHAFTLIRG